MIAAIAAATANAGETASPLEAAKKLAASKTRAERIRALRRLKALARPGTTRGDEATYRYAELCLRFHREGERAALKQAKSAFANLQKNSGSRWGLRGQIGLWRILALEDKRAEATRQLDRFLGRNTKCERAVEAAWHLGCLHAEKKDDIRELKSAERALLYASELHKSVAKYTPPLVSARAIAARLAWVQKRIRELEAGRLKVLFAKAEKLRKATKFDPAMKIYRRIRAEFPGHDLAELSGVRVAECFLGKKELKKAIAEAREFIALDPLGAYRGHAHLLVGDIHLEHYFNVKGCEPEFRCILDPKKSRPRWVEPLRRNLIAYRKLDPKKTPPATDAHKSWKQVLHSAHERAGILEYLRRDYKKAGQHFDASAKLKPDFSYGKHEGQGMADLAYNIRRKAEIIPESMLAERAERPKLVLLLATLYMGGWRDDRALNLLRRVAGGEFKEASLNQKAYAQCKIAEGLFYKIKDEKAIKVLKLFLKKPYNRSPFAARALLQLSVVTNRRDRFEESLTYLDMCHARFPHTYWGRSSLYQKAYALYHANRPDEALRHFRDYVAKYPNAFPVKQGHAASFIRKIRKQLAEEKKEKAEAQKKKERAR